MSDSNSRDPVLSWLMEGDPSIRWQVMRDLLDAPRAEWLAEQACTTRHGWGARLLARRDDTGRWTPRFYGKKWISTTYSMALLRRLGLPRDNPLAAGTCLIFLDEGLRRDGGIDPSVSLKRSETCVTGIVLALLSRFDVVDPRRERLIDYLLDEQMEDGGWNCLRFTGSVHGSFHTTINVLEGLREYADAVGLRKPETLAVEARAREFFLEHRLYRSHRTGEVANPAFTRFAFPPRWHHDLLRTLDYFGASGAKYDERLEDPIGLLKKKRRSDGCWVLQNRHPGRTFFELEKPGKPSRWNTLRALRVLRWWEKAKKTAGAL